MRVVIVSTYQHSGGAAIAAHRLHLALRQIGVDSRMVVQYPHWDYYDEKVYPPVTFSDRLWKKLRLKFSPLIYRPYKKNLKTPFDAAWVHSRDVVRRINDLNPDIVHLQWVNGGFLKVEDIAFIESPVIWTLHDTWLFTGGCHYFGDCEKYKSACGACPQLGSLKEKDLSRWIWYRKQRTLERTSVNVVCLTEWLKNCAADSGLLKNHRLFVLPNPIDTDVFRPLDKISCRNLWKLPEEKKLVLFGAVDPTGDPRKGYKQLLEALSFLENRDDVELVVFGGKKGHNLMHHQIPVHVMGEVREYASLVTLYNAVDVMVVPSLQDNLVQTAVEALSCGVPVVAFAATGLLDIVDHQINGYLAKPFDTQDLAEGIRWVLDHSNDTRLRSNAREKAVSTFHAPVVAQRYLELYQRVLNNDTGK